MLNNAPASIAKVAHPGTSARPEWAHAALAPFDRAS
jgi:hypothetical protein